MQTFWDYVEYNDNKYINNSVQSNRNIIIALNICTYKRNDFIKKNVEKLISSSFFDKKSTYYGKLYIFIVDNASELKLPENEHMDLIYNSNNGGAGGFQKGLEKIRNSGIAFTHMIFMDDDVNFLIDSFYILYDFLCRVKDEYLEHPVAGRMFCMDNPTVQYTAAEIWNNGDIRHIGYMQDMSTLSIEDLAHINDNFGAEYGGFWFCCYPMSFAATQDILPFFLHCDDVEYGLRCGKAPIIINGVQVWHETFEKRKTPLILYYDTRNTLFVNEIYSLMPDSREVYRKWKRDISAYHMKRDWLSEYYMIKAMNDFLKGLDWLKAINSERYHNKLKKVRSCKIKNAIMWRIVQYKYIKKRLL